MSVAIVFVLFFVSFSFHSALKEEEEKIDRETKRRLRLLKLKEITQEGSKKCKNPTI
jgi:choline-glycine betaine transporter